jgi:MoxR-like ATPase
MTSSASDAGAARDAAHRFVTTYEQIRAQVQRVIVGQENVIEGVLTALLAGGHVLLEGVPGLGKTRLVRALSDAVDLKFSRIQFTPDMMPADIQGTSVLVDTPGGGHNLEFREGPLVANLVLADEINRATPKTQSALLEAMQESQLSVGTRTIKLDPPYCVMATQNPVEQEGTYPLPEAQLDRFLLKLVVGYPREAEYHEILERTVGTADDSIEACCHGPDIMSLREVVRMVPVPDHVRTYAVQLVMGTQPGSAYAAAQVNNCIALGASPRGAQAILLAGKVKALLAGRFAVAIEDVRAVAKPALRHRLMVNFHGQSDGVTADDVVETVMAHVQPPNGLD